MSKSDAYIRVTCDTCGEFDEVELAAIAGRGYDERNVDKELSRLGWRDEGGNLHTCSVCLETGEDE